MKSFRFIKLYKTYTQWGPYKKNENVSGCVVRIVKLLSFKIYSFQKICFIRFQRKIPLEGRVVYNSTF